MDGELGFLFIFLLNLGVFYTSLYFVLMPVGFWQVYAFILLLIFITFIILGVLLALYEGGVL